MPLVLFPSRTSFKGVLQGFQAPQGAPQGENTKGTFVKGHLCAYPILFSTSASLRSPFAAARAATAEEAAPSPAAEDAAPAPKKRGRPPKSPAAADEAEAPAPQKRGRPPKAKKPEAAKPQATETNAATGAAATEATVTDQGGKA